MKHKTHKLMIAGGGTGGHVLAGVAVADSWKQKFSTPYQYKILFVGAEGGIEEKLVPRAGYDLKCLRLGPLKSVSWGTRLRTLILIPFSLGQSAVWLLRFRPSAVLGVGGYASGPLVLMARLLGWTWGARVAVLEQNAVPGFTNRVLGFFVHEVYAAFPGVEAHFSKKVIVTGNPVRDALKPMQPAPEGPFGVFIFGGSQGALGMNTLILEALEHAPDLKGRLSIVHQTGERDYERMKAAHEKLGFTVRIEKFIYDMPTEYANASLIICRSGSSTLAEIAAVGRAAILVPLPTAADNHQEKNAQIFANRGAAVLVNQKTAKGEDLAAILRDFVENSGKIREMEKAVLQLYKPSAAQEIVAYLTNEETR